METQTHRRTSVRVKIRRLLLGCVVCALAGVSGCKSVTMVSEMEALGYSPAYTNGYIRANDPGFAPLMSLGGITEDNPEYKRGYEDAKAGYDYHTAQRQAPPR